MLASPCGVCSQPATSDALCCGSVSTRDRRVSATQGAPHWRPRITRMRNASVNWLRNARTKKSCRRKNKVQVPMVRSRDMNPSPQTPARPARRRPLRVDGVVGQADGRTARPSLTATLGTVPATHRSVRRTKKNRNPHRCGFLFCRARRSCATDAGWACAAVTAGECSLLAGPSGLA